MIRRLADVLYWTGCLAAALCVGGGIFVYFLMVNTNNPVDVASAPMVGAIVAACGLIPWIIGRAVRYVLSGF